MPAGTKRQSRQRTLKSGGILFLRYKHEAFYLQSIEQCLIMRDSRYASPMRSGLFLRLRRLAQAISEKPDGPFPK